MQNRSIEMNDLNRALRQAAIKGDHLEISRLYRESGVDVNAIGGDDLNTALDLAISHGHTKATQALLVLGADIQKSREDGSGQTPLHTFAESCDASILDDLLEYHANVNSIRADGMTPLCLVATAGERRDADWQRAGGAQIHQHGGE